MRTLLQETQGGDILRDIEQAVADLSSSLQHFPVVMPETLANRARARLLKHDHLSKPVSASPISPHACLRLVLAACTGVGDDAGT